MLRRFILLLSLMSPAALAAPAPAPHATVAIDGASRRLVAPELYGLFFEDINYGGEGGLYAELIRNRFFEETIVPPRCTVTAEGHLCNPGGWRSPFPVTDPLPGWRLLGPRTTATPAAQPLLHPAREHSLRVTLAPGSDPAGLAALGFGGIAVRAGERYRLTVWARGTATFSAPLTATLVAPGASGASEIGGLSASGLETNLKSEIALPHAAPPPLSAPTPLPALSADTWTRHDLELTATTTHPRAELHLTAPAGAEGTFWLGGVSLFPARTWKDRPNGLRPDLAEKLAALRPRFFRFPGGCVVEGFSRETAINWKHTLGPIEERRGHWSLWSYRDTSGLGYHEYLTLCEDLGADAMWVFNAGLSCQGRAPEVVPLDQLQPLVQDALDGIEYALGDVTTPWGARRAAAGHPAPFPLRYVSIGNENWGPDYETRYRVFYDAIRARYPGLQIIATAAVASAPVEILDEHFYPDPDFFIAHHDHYDDYPRTGPRIFVGEFASILNCGQGNLRAAVGEAAFLIGMERNPDLVRMAAYAPLFKNVFHPNPWNPDAIVFDTHRAYGTPSYHVLELFGRTRGTHQLTTTVTTPDRDPAGRGGIGLGTHAAQAEFRALRVENDGRLLHAFPSPAAPAPAASSSLAAYTRRTPAWETTPDGLRTTSVGDTLALLADQPWETFTLSLEARLTAGPGGLRLRLLDNGREDQNRAYLEISLGGPAGDTLRLERFIGWTQVPLARPRPVRLEPGRWHRLEVAVTPRAVTVRLDGAEVLTGRRRPLPDLVSVATLDENTGDLLVKLVNTADAPRAVRLTLADLPPRAATGEVETITASSPDAENSFDTPRAVAPERTTLAALGADFTHLMPAHAVQVLRLPPATGTPR